VLRWVPLGYWDKNRNYSDWCAAALWGISRNMVRANWRTLNLHGNRLPEDRRRPEEQCSSCTGAEALGVSANASQFALEVRVREAVHIAATGGTSADFVAATQRFRLAGVPMGTKYDHHAFMEEVEHLAVVCCRDLVAATVGQIIPSLGIPSDLALIWDGVSIGGSCGHVARPCA
jgi:hypothetical protein